MVVGRGFPAHQRGSHAAWQPALGRPARTPIQPHALLSGDCRPGQLINPHGRWQCAPYRPNAHPERLMAIGLRYTVNTHLEDQGITTPAAIGAAASLPAAEAVGLLPRRRWRLVVMSHCAGQAR